jgi:hypothetical protein
VDSNSLPAATLDDAMEPRPDLLRSMLDDLNQAQAVVLRLRLMLGRSTDHR